MSNYIPTIGIETHVQLKTKTKLFSAVDNDARSAEPNSLISHIDAGMPGALPVLNEKAVELTVRAGLALNGEIQSFSKFDRKHYFYPDLPKGYQISQYDEPLVKGGHVEVEVDGERKKISLVRIHLEEDAGKTTHPVGADYSLVDLNRAGTPLIEIVSKPDMQSAAEAKAYARELYLIMKHAGVSDCDLYQGHMRFDVNVSVSKDSSKPGTRTETKNLNSFRSVENAVNYEIKRQIELLKKGGEVKQETRGWDEAKQKTTPQRSKEEAEDYRYMPEPDIPPLELDEAFIQKAKSELPRLPSGLRLELSKLGIDKNQIEDLIDRPVSLSKILDVLAKGGAGRAKTVAFWILRAPVDEVAGELNVDTNRLIELARMVESGDLNSTAAQRIFDELPKTDKNPAKIASELNLLQLSDEDELEKIVQEVINANSQAAADAKAGQEKAIGFLVGQVMAKTKGQANPALTSEIIRKSIFGS